MATDSPIDTPLTSLDFDGIKESLKDYLKSLPTFTDYDFEGSALSHLLDILAYNTHYQAFYANMVANEMFLDTAVTRPSVVSRAKHLGYIPSSFSAAKATVDISYPSAQTDAVVPARSIFTARGVDGSSFTFTNPSAHTINGFTAENVEIYEGSYKNYTYVVDSSDASQKFIIPSKTVDTQLLNIRVQTSVTDTTGYLNEWTLADNILDITNTSYAYWVQEIENGYYEIYFGDGIVGQKVSDGNLVMIEYFETNGPDANDTGSNDSTSTRAFTMSGSGGASVIVKQKAVGGGAKENTESVRFYAPKAYQSQNRSVTVDDYTTNIKKDYSNVESIYVWGGEDNDPPQYGKVFVAIKPQTGTMISEGEKKSIVDTYIKNKSLVTIIPEVVDPDYIYLLVDSQIYYDPAKTKLSSAEIEALAKIQILSYADNDLEKFTNNFLYSVFTTKLNRIDISVTNNRSIVTMQKRLSPLFGVSSTYDIKFNNALEHPHDGHMPGTIRSDAFLYKKKTGETTTAYMEDDGFGRIQLYEFSGSIKVIFQENIGTVNYDTGLVTLTSFAPNQLEGQSFIKINAKPRTLDIIASKRDILLIDRNDSESIKTSIFTSDSISAVGSVASSVSASQSTTSSSSGTSSSY